MASRYDLIFLIVNVVCATGRSRDVISSVGQLKQQRPSMFRTEDVDGIELDDNSSPVYGNSLIPPVGVKLRLYTRRAVPPLPRLGRYIDERELSSSTRLGDPQQRAADYETDNDDNEGGWTQFGELIVQRRRRSTIDTDRSAVPAGDDQKGAPQHLYPASQLETSSTTITASGNMQRQQQPRSGDGHRKSGFDRPVQSSSGNGQHRVLSAQLRPEFPADDDDQWSVVRRVRVLPRLGKWDDIRAAPLPRIGRRRLTQSDGDDGRPASERFRRATPLPRTGRLIYKELTARAPVLPRLGRDYDEEDGETVRKLLGGSSMSDQMFARALPLPRIGRDSYNRIPTVATRHYSNGDRLTKKATPLPRLGK